MHLTGTAALAPLTCEHRSALWAMHGLTAATLVVVARHTLLSWRLRLGGGDARLFLARLGVILNVTNLALIALEGSFVLFVHPCA
ncbi:MAG: hypothetical protein H0W70_14405 [Actinobacteria bacterium]|nr:hypothetical protein [Actinomycetota bacterium]